MTKAVELAQVASTGVSQGFRNRIINGAMTISQRGTSSFTAADNLYTLDRWVCAVNPASKFTVIQSSDAPAGFNNSLLVTSSSAYTVGAAEYETIAQRIEGYNIADLGFGTASAKTITISFWVKSSLTGSFGAAITNLGETRCYPFSYTISAANTWEQKSVTIAGDTTGSWGTTNSTGINLYISLGTGTNLSGTAGAWTGSTKVQPTGSVSVVGTNGATFYITGVQLEVGSTATSFDYRPYGTELALCQRYFEWCSIAVWTGAQNYPVVYKVQKRTQPSIGNYLAENGLTNNFFANCPSSGTAQGNATAGTLGAYYSGAPNVNAVATFSSNAEL